MKTWRKIIFIISIVVASATAAVAQCSICTKTAQQLGEKPAKALNTGIVYLAFTPIAIIGIVAYRWYKGNKES
jgi:NO-binding membrane sensor protein with MHYT domain